MSRCHTGQEAGGGAGDWGAHTLPRAGRGAGEEEGVRRVLTVQEKLHGTDAPPPPAELYVNLLEEEENTMR